ncbi:hypothetical protein [Streptomyces sp. NBC_01012]|uniref:hypothetical protein n=1 Tax=Streptomyces sp. NBC_01012 TaxID=2903717 RepID=UPI00386923EA|nr:hypothetical protein OG623_34885 [Streptomyces sp. NBC_01012]
MSKLKELYEAAGGHHGLGYARLICLAKKHGHEVSKSSLGEWFGKAPPRKPEHVTYVTRVLIPFLEARAAQRSPGFRGSTVGGSAGAWGRWLKAAQDVSKSGQGGRGSRVHAASRGRLLSGPSQALLDVLPNDLEDREGEVAELQAFVTAPDGAPAYLWWQAGPWAGKTALAAWFATQALPAGVDVAHYVIAGRLGTDRRDGFVQAIGEQLAAAAGSRRRPAVDRKQPNLEPLYKAAARECEGRNRRLVLIVDGLDEDADVGLDGTGIAGLLPKVPPHGMRVIVTGRPHPRVPVKLAPDHPLRDPAIVRRLTASPAAQVIRDTAMAELRTLLDDRDIGRSLLGLLVAARGGLTAADLGDLLEIPPHDVQAKLRTVVARSMAPTRTDLLPLDVRTAAEAEASRQTFVLAHSTLHATASEELGRRFLTERTHDLDRWAQQYRDEGWPEDTPSYLLTGYTRLLHEKRRTKELTALVLAPERQLRLAQRSGPDVALAQLDLITSSVRDHSAPLNVAEAAAAAASREMLLAHVQPLPASVARTIARLGDAQRARALAGASGNAIDKALNLTGVARVLLAMDDEQASAAAREAGEWARTALREADRLGHSTDEAEAAAAQAALALLESAQGRGRSRDLQHQHEDGLVLLRSTRGTSTGRNEAWAQAALLLTPDHPEHAAELLDELEEQAETLAAEDPAEGGVAAGAVQLWQTVVSVAPDRADRVHDRVLAHAAEVWQNAPTLENVSVIAAAASFVAHDQPAQAEQLVATACQHLERTLHADAGLLSAADAFHIEFGFRHTLIALSQAVADVGAPPETAARVLQLGQRALPLELADQLEQSAPDEDEDHAFAEAGAFADQAFQLADRGAVNDAEHHLEQALALLPTAGPGMDRSPAWLPDLVGALIRTDAASSAEPLLELVQHPADRVRIHAATALAYADSRQLAAARHHAQKAARAAASAPAPNASWAYAAQALACAGEVEPSMNLIMQHKLPDRAGGQVAWQKADRAARIAVAAELATHDPEAAGELIHPLLKRLDATRHAIHSEGPLTSLAELLPATAHLPSAQQSLFDAVMERAREQVAKSSPQSWRPESVLLDAFLHIGAGEEPARQLDWLTRDLANRGARLFPTAALAVLHAALCDTATAQRVAALPAAPHQKAAALSAVASHLARVPSRPCPVPDSIGTDRFTHAIQHLALKVTSATRPDNETPIKLLHHALATGGWHHAIPVLARLAPQAIAVVRDITATHLGASHVSRT